MAIEAVADFGLTLASALLEATYYVLKGIAGPVRFAFSSKYRARKREQWSQRPWRGVGEITGSVLALTAFVGLAWMWGSMAHSAIEDRRHPERVQRREAAWQLLKEKVWVEMEKSRQRQAGDKQRSENKLPPPP